MDHLYQASRSFAVGEQVGDGDSGLVIRGFRPVAHPLRRPISEFHPSAPGYFNTFPNSSSSDVDVPPPPTYDKAILNEKLPAARFRIFPREEEGRECLPEYSCSLNIESMFFRKMELDSPFDRCYDRAWHKVFVVLEGTMLSIHKVKTPGFFSKTSYTDVGTQDRPAGTSAGKKLRSYTLQHAEFGIAADYAKRHFVIRIRVETDQFLLSCATVETFLTWLECLGAAIDLSPPLDERSLPRYQTIPRRRRRHRAEVRREQEEIINQYYPHMMTNGERETPSNEDPAAEAVVSALSANNEAVEPPANEISNSLAQAASTAVNRLSLNTVPAMLGEVSALLRAQARDDEATWGRTGEAPPTREPATTDELTIEAAPVALEPSTVRARTPKTPSATTRRFSAFLPQFDSSIRRRSTAQESVDSGDIRMLNESLMATPRRSTDGGRPNVSGTNPAEVEENSETADGKWNPHHTWTEAHNIRYARRCMSVLCSDAPRQSDVIVKFGRRWKIRWDLGELTPFEADEPPDYAPSRSTSTSTSILEPALF
ncbi:MAG: hypothetical protein M4579_006323 [Chaenotheca gracillima]|nr:MAG: hypothetical protein M4579_006323 [Chaenotheca gracillima]